MLNVKSYSNSLSLLYISIFERKHEEDISLSFYNNIFYDGVGRTHLIQGTEWSGQRSAGEETLSDV